MESALGGETVTEKVKKRVSKWDLVEDTKCPTETVRDNSKSADVADAHHDKDANSGCNWSKSASTHVSKWSDWEANNTMRSEDSSGGSCCEPMPEHKGEGKDVIVDEDGEKISQTTRTRGASITSHIDLGRHHSHSRSGSPGWGRSCSRSRSPRGFKYEAENWNNRGRSGRGGSIAECRDFAAGWCRRGGQCRFLHLDDHDYDGKGHCDRVPFENRGHRLEKGRFSRYASNEAFTDSQEQSGYSRDKDLHGYESHNVRDRGKHETQRNHRSSERCDDFLKGNCHRGSACKYVHHGAKVDGCGPSKDATRHRARNRREDLPFERDQRHEPHRSTMDTLCKYFAEGRCRNGEKCKFSHQGPTFGGPEENSQDGGRGNSSASGNRPGGGLKWIDNSSGAGVGCPENVSWSDPKWGDKEADRNVSRSPFCSDTINIRADDPWNRSCEGPRWDDKPAETNFSVSPQWMSNNDGARRVPELRAADQYSNVTDMGSAGVNRDGCSHNMGRNETIHGSQDSYTWSPEADGQQLPVQKVGAVVFPSKDRPSQQKIPPPNVRNLNPSLQSQQLADALLDGLNVNLNGQSRLMAPSLPSGHMDSNGQSQGINVRSSSTDQAQMPFCQGDSSEKHDLLDGNMSQLTSDVSIPQNAATTEKGAQLTDLSASLAQIFGNGQQLPQLYATLNHLSATGLVPTQPPQSNPVRPSAPVAAPFIQPKQVPWPQSQNDPLTYSIEFVDPDINKQPARFPMNTHEQKNTSLEQLQAPQQILALSSGADNQNEGELPENGSLEKTNHEKKDNQHGLKMDTEVVEVKEVATVQREKDQQTGQLKEMDIDDQVNDEGKRSKDAKEMRMFKFALVEFVKELLKPTWKEGHMSKEAHKTIVKKVVDKVTGSLHGPHIPQTQERIDHYLSFSKPKLTKLVQTVQLLLSKSGVEVNAINANGLTAFDVLFQLNTSELSVINRIGKILEDAGAIGARVMPTTKSSNTPIDYQKNKPIGKNHSKRVQKRWSSLMVVAILLVSVTFDAARSPHRYAGELRSDLYKSYMVIDTIGFLSSISIIIMLVSKPRLQPMVLTRLLMVLVWISASSVAVTFTLFLFSNVSIVPLVWLGPLYLWQFTRFVLWLLSLRMCGNLEKKETSDIDPDIENGVVEET